MLLYFTMFLDQIIGMLSLLLSFAGVIIGIYTLLKVKGVEKAQTDARKITQELLEVNNIEADYLKMIMFLTENQEQNSKPLLAELGFRLGAIRGIRKVLSASGYGEENTTVKLEKGYFSQNFLIENIDRSRFRIDILTGRAQMVSSYSIMEKLRIACERGVIVNLITLCETSDIKILEDSLKTVAFPAPKSAQEYGEQLKQCKKEILSNVTSWKKNAQNNFHYKASKSVPRISSVRSDDYINLGFLQLYRDAQPENTSEREYIKIPTSSETGKVLLKHFDCVWNGDGVSTIFNVISEQR